MKKTERRDGRVWKLRYFVKLYSVLTGWTVFDIFNTKKEADKLRKLLADPTEYNTNVYVTRRWVLV